MPPPPPAASFPAGHRDMLANGHVSAAPPGEHSARRCRSCPVERLAHVCVYLFICSLVHLSAIRGPPSGPGSVPGTGACCPRSPAGRQTAEHAPAPRGQACGEGGGELTQIWGGDVDADTEDQHMDLLRVGVHREYPRPGLCKKPGQEGACGVRGTPSAVMERARGGAGGGGGCGERRAVRCGL